MITISGNELLACFRTPRGEDIMEHSVSKMGPITISAVGPTPGRSVSQTSGTEAINGSSHNQHLQNLNMTPRKQQQQQRKTVSFQPEVVHHEPISYESEPPPLQDLWYTRMELSNIKKGVGRILIEHVVNKRTSKSIDTSGIPELWGLERHNLERAQAKKSAVQLILMAQHLKAMKRNPELLCSLSILATRKAREFAQDQGLRDSHQHDTDAAEIVVDDCISDFDLPATCDYLSYGCKRTIMRTDCESHHERRVRPRLSLA
jgi:hypothetical protein